MSRRSHVTLIVQIRIPIPAGKTQTQTLDWITYQLRDRLDDPSEGRATFASTQTQVKLLGRETTYL